MESSHSNSPMHCGMSRSMHEDNAHCGMPHSPSSNMRSKNKLEVGYEAYSYRHFIHTIINRIPGIPPVHHTYTIDFVICVGVGQFGHCDNSQLVN